MNIKNKFIKKIKYCDSLIGYPISQIRELYLYLKLKNEFRYWKKSRKLDINLDIDNDIIDSIRRDGFVVLKGLLSEDLVDSLRIELDKNIEMHNFSKVIDMRGRADQDLPSYLSEFDLSGGADTFRDMTNYISIKQPMLSSKKLLQVVFNEKILGIACKYLGCYVGIGSVNWRKSYANNFSSMDNQMFHIDKNCVSPLKILVYLNDVDANGGPFVYVSGSHLKKFPGWRKSHRYPDVKISEHYSKENIKVIYGGIGDVIIANTSGIHKGLHPTKADRYILVTSLNAQPEFLGRSGKFKIKSEDLKNLSNFQKRAADFLIVE